MARRLHKFFLLEERMKHLLTLGLIITVACGEARIDRGTLYGDASYAEDHISGGGNGQAGAMTAGEWNDNDNWDFWTDLIDDVDSDYYGYPVVWGFQPTERVTVTAHNEADPAIDEPVTLADATGLVVWQSRTDSRGIAQLFPSLTAEHTGPFQLTVGEGDRAQTVDSITFPVSQSIDVSMNASLPEEVLDLMFVVDTTGSMGDELSYLQTELSDVISRSRQELLGEVDIRLSVNFYRDFGDAYVTRSFPFTEDISLAITQLKAQSSDGGGDWPEAVDSALVDGIHNHQWSGSARARLLFLVLDAPPHDGEQVITTLQNAVTTASAAGIKIIPIAASGIDKDTEFLLRTIDIASNGTYVFLTDDSGIGNEHLAPTVGQYTVEPLNDLLVDLITEAVAPKDLGPL
jgi:hypothetical protein